MDPRVKVKLHVIWCFEGICNRRQWLWEVLRASHRQYCLFPFLSFADPLSPDCLFFYFLSFLLSVGFFLIDPKKINILKYPRDLRFITCSFHLLHLSLNSIPPLHTIYSPPTTTSTPTKKRVDHSSPLRQKTTSPLVNHPLINLPVLPLLLSSPKKKNTWCANLSRTRDKYTLNDDGNGKPKPPLWRHELRQCLSS